MEGDLLWWRGGGDSPLWVGDIGGSSSVDSGRGGYAVRFVFWVTRDFVCEAAVLAGDIARAGPYKQVRDSNLKFKLVILRRLTVHQPSKETY